MNLTKKEKFSFGFGALGKDAICCFVGNFLMFYFTDVLFLAPTNPVFVIIGAGILKLGSGFELGLAMVGYNASLPQQSAATLNGIRIIMIVIPMIFAVISYLIYAKAYKLKGDYLDNMTKELNVIHEA